MSVALVFVNDLVLSSLGLFEGLRGLGVGIERILRDLVLEDVAVS